MGFTLQAAVAEDNYWDVALRYAGEMHGFRIASGIGYQEDTEFNGPAGFTAVAAGSDVVCNVSCNTKATDLKGATSVIHVATGLFATWSWGKRDMDNLQFATGGALTSRDGGYWHLAAGISQNFFGLGATTIFGEYGNHKDMFGLQPGVAAAATITSSEVTNWGIGIRQNIDAAAMEVFAVYKHFEGDFTSSVASAANNIVLGRNNVSDINMFIVGTKLNF